MKLMLFASCRHIIFCQTTACYWYKRVFKFECCRWPPVNDGRYYSI